jgi:hypothetical protein
MFIYLFIYLYLLFMVYLCTYAVFLLYFSFGFWIHRSLVFFFCCIWRTISCTEVFIYLFIYCLSFFCVDCSLFLLVLLLTGKIVVFATKAKNDFCSIKSLWECTIYSSIFLIVIAIINVRRHRPLFWLVAS